MRIVQGDALLWQVPAYSGHVDFFSYQHREAGSVTIEWQRPEAVLWAYGYDPADVAEAGITLWEFDEAGLTLSSKPEIEASMRSDPARPIMHFSPPASG